MGGISASLQFNSSPIVHCRVTGIRVARFRPFASICAEDLFHGAGRQSAFKSVSKCDPDETPLEQKATPARVTAYDERMQ